MKYKYTNVVDNTVEVEKFYDKESDKFPLEWFADYPADEGGDSMLQTSDEVLEVETCDFEDISIRINLCKSHRSWEDMDEAEGRTVMAMLSLQSRAVKDLVQKFMDDLLDLGVCDVQSGQLPKRV